MDPSTIDSATTHADLKSVFIERAVEDIERQNPSRSHEDHLSEWIGNASALSDNDQVILDPEDGSLASRLYASCMQVLQGICVRLSASKAALPGVNLGTLKEELAKLYLLGEGMNNGKLDKALQDADDLREIFLEVLVSIGRLLIRGECSISFLMIYVMEYWAIGRRDRKICFNRDCEYEYKESSANYMAYPSLLSKVRCTLNENYVVLLKG